MNHTQRVFCHYHLTTTTSRLSVKSGGSLGSPLITSASLVGTQLYCNGDCAMPVDFFMLADSPLGLRLATSYLVRTLYHCSLASRFLEPSRPY